MNADPRSQTPATVFSKGECYHSFLLLYLLPLPVTLPPMSAESSPYSPCYIKAWTLLSIILGIVIFGMLVLGDHFLYAGQVVWDLIRWLASPII